MVDNKDYKMRREKTREPAIALVDDLAFFRSVLKSEKTTAGDLRRMSAQLRRILVDGTLEKIAGPRVGSLLLVAPDTASAVAANRSDPLSCCRF